MRATKNSAGIRAQARSRLRKSSGKRNSTSLRNGPVGLHIGAPWEGKCFKGLLHSQPWHNHCA